MKNQVQLIAYVDRLSGGDFRDFRQLLEGPLDGAFGGVHVLPFFHPIDGADAGFDPIDHTAVDPRLGTWDDVRRLAGQTEVMADVIVNHISRRSPQFRDYEAHGDDSCYAGMFLTFSRVFPHGAQESELIALHHPGPILPFTPFRTARGQQFLLWTTFTSEQIDLDVSHPESRRYLDLILAQLHAAGIRAIRLDAVGYAVKKAGTNCFMIPETFAFIADISARAHALGIEVLVEVHSHHEEQMRIARHVDWVYDFALPPLLLHTLYSHDGAALRRWIAIRPRNAITVLDTHDGIGVHDVDASRDGRPGLLSSGEIRSVVERIEERSGGESRQASGGAASNVDSSQINCTFYDALGRRDHEYLVARALQCFIPGIPQIYYVGLLAGTNDMALLRRTGVGRDINRRYYGPGQAERESRRPVVQSLLRLLRLRNTHPAFAGAFELVDTASNCLVLGWRDRREWATLEVALDRMSATVTGSSTERGREVFWQSSVETPA